MTQYAFSTIFLEMIVLAKCIQTKGSSLVKTPFPSFLIMQNDDEFIFEKMVLNGTARYTITSKAISTPK